MKNRFFSQEMLEFREKLDKMGNFGSLLQHYRKKSGSLTGSGKWLTQAQLGEEIGRIVGDNGYSGAAVSEWERGKSDIPKDNRTILAALVEVLYRQGGLQSADQAQRFLESGNYAPLNSQDRQRIFGIVDEDVEVTQSTHATPDHATPDEEGQWQLFIIVLRRLISQPDALIVELSGQHSDQIPPGNGLIRLLTWSTEGWNSNRMMRFIMWLALLIGMYRWMFPVLLWSEKPDYIANQTQLLTYAITALTIPILAGTVHYSVRESIWHERQLATSKHRLFFAISGAYLGQALAITIILLLGLIKTYIWNPAAPIWLSLLLAAIAVSFIKQSAREFEHINWSLSGKLHVSPDDVTIAIAFAGLAMALGALIQLGHTVFLRPDWGIPLLLCALFLCAAIRKLMEQWGYGRVIPVHFWVWHFGAIFILYQLSEGMPLIATAPFAILILSTGILIERNRIRFNLKGISIAACTLFILLLVTALNRWVGLSLLPLFLAAKWKYDQNNPDDLHIGTTCIIIFLTLIASIAAIHFALLSVHVSMSLLALITLILLWADSRLAQPEN